MFIYIVATTLIFVSTAVSAQLPQLKLPWGTWEGTPYPQDPNVSSPSTIVFHLMLEKPKNKEWSILIKGIQIYLFKNVRFGAKPERFNAPEFPDCK